jgi:hypothetical protein
MVVDLAANSDEQQPNEIDRVLKTGGDDPPVFS